MSIALVNTFVNPVTSGTSTTLLPAGNYTLQDISIKVPAFLTTATGFYEYIGTITSGGNVVHSVFMLGTSTVTTWQGVNYDFSRSFAKPPLDSLILTPNSSLVFNCTSTTNMSNIRFLINISGFKS